MGNKKRLLHNRLIIEEAAAMLQAQKRAVSQTRALNAARKREELIMEHVPLIKYHAYRIATQLPPNIEINDLINAGVLGLMDAVEKFEPSRGVKFKTYAELRIRGAMLDSLRELDWAPRSLRKKSKELTKASQRLQQELGREASDFEICEEMGIELNELFKLTDRLKGLTIGSFYDVSHKFDDEDGDSECLINYYPDGTTASPYFAFEKEELKKILAEAIDALPRKERLVVSLYYFEELTMKEIGAVLRVNESRVSQLHTKAVLRLKTKLKNSSYRPK
jgi:RNA polymerase sigma factor for flagellar operon FliA